MNIVIQFIANTDDDQHCVPASFQMIAKYFQPELSIEWDEWSSLMGYAEGLSVWPASGLLWFAQNGYEVKDIELFDYHAFIIDGGDYLLRTFGQETGQWQIGHSDIPTEQHRAEELVRLGITEPREPSIQDIHSLLDDGFVLRAPVNSKKLNGKSGYVGHSVVIIGYDEATLTIHDPGLPAMPSRVVENELFESAWAYPNVLSKELNAIKLKSPG